MNSKGHSIVDFESRVPAAHRQLYLVHRSDVCGTGAAFELPAEFANRLRFSLGDRFYTSVRQIPNNSHHARVPGGAGDEVAKANTLDSSTYYESPCDHT